MLNRSSESRPSAQPGETLNIMPTEGTEVHKRRSSGLRRMGRVMAAVILAAALALSIACAESPTFRAGVLNVLTEIRNGFTVYRFRWAQDPPNAETDFADMPFSFVYIPAGYDLLDSEVDTDYPDGTVYFCAYGDVSSDTDNFYLQITPVSQSANIYIDTNAAQVTEMEIRGSQGKRIQKVDDQTKKPQLAYVWVDQNTNQLYYFFSLGLSYEEAEKVYQGIVFQEDA